MISINVCNNKLNNQGFPQHATMTHLNLFEFLVTGKKMSLELCESINSANVSTIVRNNVVKHVAFSDPNYDI